MRKKERKKRKRHEERVEIEKVIIIRTAFAIASFFMARKNVL